MVLPTVGSCSEPEEPEAVSREHENGEDENGNCQSGVLSESDQGRGEGIFHQAKLTDSRGSVRAVSAAVTALSRIPPGALRVLSLARMPFHKLGPWSRCGGKTPQAVLLNVIFGDGVVGRERTFAGALAARGDARGGQAGICEWRAKRGGEQGPERHITSAVSLPLCHYS